MWLGYHTRKLGPLTPQTTANANADIVTISHLPPHLQWQILTPPLSFHISPPSPCHVEHLHGRRSIQAVGATHIPTISDSTLLCSTSLAYRWLPMSLTIFALCMRIRAPFCPAAIVDAEHLLGLRRKASSTTRQRHRNGRQRRDNNQLTSNGNGDAMEGVTVMRRRRRLKARQR